MVENKLNDALIERIQNAPQDPSIVDMKLSNGFASLMVWADFFALSRREREFLFYLRDQIETFERDTLVIEPVPRQAVDAPPADSTQSGAAPDLTNRITVKEHERTMYSPSWDDSGSPPSYGPIERHRLPDEDVMEKVREHLREPASSKLFPPPDVSAPARKKPGREYKKKEEPVPPIPQSLEVMHVCSRCEAGYENAALLRNHERKHHGLALDCIHSWLLGAPIGPIVTGTCKFCSALKDFPSDKQAVPLSLQQGRRSK